MKKPFDANNLIDIPRGLWSFTSSTPARPLLARPNVAGFLFLFGGSL